VGRGGGGSCLLESPMRGVIVVAWLPNFYKAVLESPMRGVIVVACYPTTTKPSLKY